VTTIDYSPYSPSEKNATGKYFATDEAKNVADMMIHRISAWQSSLESNGYMEKMRMCWAAYHGAYYTDFGYGHQITFSGSQGELTNLPVNHFRNLAQHMLVMTTSNRPAMQARATNTDYKSLVQTQLANGLLDYYLREKRLEKYLRVAVEYAIVLSAGYIKMEWDATSGDVYDTDEETGLPIYEGDIAFTNLSPFDMMFDPTKENQDHEWVLVRTYKNRYDLMAKFPEFADEIKKLQTKSDRRSFGVGRFGYNETDDVSVYEFFHEKTEAMPNGRYIMFASPETVFIDHALPYKKIPIFRISASDILGTPFGYSPMFDVLPLQEGINTLYSTILSNQNAFGVQNIYVPRGADVNIQTLAGGLNIVEGNPQAGEIRPLNLTSTPKEVFDFLGILERAAETISGVNSVARGNPEPSLKSGAALALVQSMALQFMSGLQQQYVQLIEDVGTGIINLLQDFAAVPRVAAIVGKNQRAYLQEFKGDDLSSIQRVIVDVGNPLSRTTAGRVQMAEQLLQMGLITNPQDYFAVINTGQLEVMTENTNSEIYLIKGENEALIAGEEVPVIDVDDHKQHILEHKAILADPHLRKDAALVQRVLGHMQKHIEALRQTDPNLLSLLNQQPLSGPGGTPPAGPQGMPPPPGAPQPPGPAGAMQGPPPGAPQPNQPGMPQMPTPPPPFEALPTNPQDMLPPG
jgi:hypothetical protein